MSSHTSQEMTLASLLSRRAGQSCENNVVLILKKVLTINVVLSISAALFSV